MPPENTSDASQNATSGHSTIVSAALAFCCGLALFIGELFAVGLFLMSFGYDVQNQGLEGVDVAYPFIALFILIMIPIAISGFVAVKLRRNHKLFPAGIVGLLFCAPLLLTAATGEEADLYGTLFVCLIFVSTSTLSGALARRRAA